MEQRNNKQNSVIFQVDEILNKMSNQVSFLIRKDQLMNQLDVDMLMENTRKLYDTLCSVRCNMDTDSIPMEIVEETSETENLKISETENLKISETENLRTLETENLEETSEEELSNSATQQLSNLEYNLGDSEENLGDSEEKEDSVIRAYKKEHQTLGDMLELIEDNSLAARLQRKPVADLMTAIGINDKFLLLNDLFAGSMEKYNRSVRALNNFPTLLGAKTYMSELQIEFQWDINSEAYRKLNDLVERRFTPIHNS